MQAGLHGLDAPLIIANSHTVKIHRKFIPKDVAAELPPLLVSTYSYCSTLTTLG